MSDIDVLKDGGEEWRRHLEAIGIPNSEYQPYAHRRKSIHDKLAAIGKEFKRNGGIQVLEGSAKEAAENLLSDLRRYGLFVVPHGEVENWLTGLDVPRTKQGWLRGIFSKMGSDPTDPLYVTPAEGDVWDFVGNFNQWIGDQERKGIPD